MLNHDLSFTNIFQISSLDWVKKKCVKVYQIFGPSVQKVKVLEKPCKILRANRSFSYASRTTELIPQDSFVAR